MSRCHTRGSYSWCEKKAVFFHFFIYFCSFPSFRLFRWFRFGRFVSLFRVLVHVVWVPGYRGLEVSRRTISSLLPKPNGGPVRRIFFSQASPVLDCSFAAEKNACNTLPKQASLGDSPVRILWLSSPTPSGIKICLTTATNRWECRIFSRPGWVEI